MRLASATLPLSALLTAACSSGPSVEQKNAAQTEMQNCVAGKGLVSANAPALTDVSAKLTGIDGEKIVAQQYPDFSIKGTLPEYEEKGEDGKKKTVAKVNVGIVFKSEAGKLSAELAGSKFTTFEDGTSRNNPLYTEEVDPAATDFKGINVAAILSGGRACASGAQAKLGLDM